MCVTVRVTPATLAIRCGHQFGDRLVIWQLADGDQVHITGAGIDLVDAGQVGDLLGGLGDRRGLDVDHDDDGDHVPILAPSRRVRATAPRGPGGRTTPAAARPGDPPRPVMAGLGAVQPVRPTRPGDRAGPVAVHPDQPGAGRLQPGQQGADLLRAGRRQRTWHHPDRLGRSLQQVDHRHRVDPAGGVPGRDQPAGPDDHQPPATRAVRCGRHQFGDRGQRTEPLPPAQRRDQGGRAIRWRAASCTGRRRTTDPTAGRAARIQRDRAPAGHQIGRRSHGRRTHRPTPAGTRRATPAEIGQRAGFRSGRSRRIR